MKSMTGYGHVERSSSERDLSVEVRGVNNRYLEVSTSLPSFLGPLETDIKARVSARAQRGKVEVQIRLREYETALSIHVNPAAVRAAKAALDEIQKLAALSSEPSYQDILSFDGVIQTDRRRDPEAYRDEIFVALEEALDQWDAARQAEGAATARDISSHLGRVQASAATFASAAPETEQLVLSAVKSRFREVLGDEVEEQRILAEAANLMVKHATSEEVARLESHIASFRELLSAPGSVGKRLDFICQEMNREINTTGSKTVLASVQDAVVEAKDAVEAIREQVRNVE